MTDHPLRPADAIDRRMLWYFYLLPITFVASLLFGIAMFWIQCLNPWNAFLTPFTDWLLQSTTILNRFRLSVDFCGSCGERYLLTVELFLFFCVLYAVLLAHSFGRMCLQPAKYLTTRNVSASEIKVVAKAAATSVAICCLFGFMLWSLLFSVSFARPSGTSNSDYSTFNFTLLLQVSIAFHILMLFLWGSVFTLGILVGSIIGCHRNRHP